jgi:hypothetical protein
MISLQRGGLMVGMQASRPLPLKIDKMEATTSMLDPLLERVEAYSKTSIELLKLQSLDKTAAVTSTLISRLSFVIVLSFFTLTLSTGIALWLGEILGKSYYGFLVVASFYALTGVILFFLHTRIKASVNNSIITQMLN